VANSIHRAGAELSYRVSVELSEGRHDWGVSSGRREEGMLRMCVYACVREIFANRGDSFFLQER
jgi:hypothetical protein